LGLIEPLGTWILQQACRTFADWQRRFPAGGLDFITVNVSSRQLTQQNFMGIVEQALEQAGLKPRDVRLEITETALMDNPREAAKLLKELRDFGLKIYLDDFGTGYSSLSYLQRFPVTAIKIARDFVAVDESDADGWELASAIVSMGRALRLTVIAEGVEEPFQLERLRKLRCGRAQGYYLARPLPAEELERLFDQPETSWIRGRASVPELLDISSRGATPAA